MDETDKRLSFEFAVLVGRQELLLTCIFRRFLYGRHMGFKHMGLKGLGFRGSLSAKHNWPADRPFLHASPRKPVQSPVCETGG